jgi:predicted phage terminase large subunit-like protein
MVRIAKYNLMASLCKDSFYEFVKEFWHIVIQEKPVWNWHIKFMCDELQEAAERVFRGEPKLHDYIINIPPGTTKSTICSVMYPAWILSRMPNARIICGSHTENLCLDLSNKCRLIVQSEQYQLCFPYVEIRDTQNTKGYWATTKGGFRFSATVGGKNPMGFHAHFLIVDDPIDPQKAFSETELKVANDFMNLTIANRKVDSAISVTLLIMQRLHQDDPTGNRLANKAAGKVRWICLPAEVSDKVKPGYLKAKYVDGLLDPVRLSAKVLEEKKSMGQYGYSGQYRQFPVPPGGGMFQIVEIRPAALPLKFDMVVRGWDKAGTVDGGAHTAGVKIGMVRVDGMPRFYVLDVVRGQWGSAQREQMIRTTAELDGRGVVIAIEQEPGSGGKESAEMTVRRLAGYIVRVERPTGDKILRADPFSVQVNSGNVFVPRNGNWVRVYLDEMMFFPYGKYKDQVDATSLAFTILTKPRIRVGAL